MSKIYGYCRVSTNRQSLQRQEEIIKEQYPDAIFITDKTTGRNFDRQGWKRLCEKIKKDLEEKQDVTIVFDEVSRMSRDAEEGFKTYEELFSKGVNLIFIAEPHINTSTYREALKTVVNADIESGDEATDDLVSDIIKALNKFMMAKVKGDIKRAFEKSQNGVDLLSRRTSTSLQAKMKRNKELEVLYPDTYKDHPEYRRIGQEKGSKFTTKKSIAAKEIILKRSKTFNGDLSDDEVMKLCGVSRMTYYKYKRELKEDMLQVKE